jgi:hypothetical protein
LEKEIDDNGGAHTKASVVGLKSNLLVKFSFMDLFNYFEDWRINPQKQT